jgi:predicted PurR-regulated permease PerM
MSRKSDPSNRDAGRAKPAGKVGKRKGPDPALLRLLLFSGVLIGVLVVLLIFRRIFLPLLLGFALAYLFHPLVTWFETRGRSRVTGVIVLVLLLVLVLTLFFLYLIPQIGDQVQRLAERYPEYRGRVEAQVKPWLDQVRARWPEALDDLQQRAIEWAKEHSAELANTLGAWLGRVFSSLLDGVLFLLNLIFVPVFAFYLLVDFPRIQQGARDLIPLPYRKMTLERLKEVDDALSSFVRGQLTIALVLGVLNALGLMILGVPLGLVIGLVAGLANMIPYMSIVVGLVPALLLAWVEHQSVWILVGVVVVFSATQLLEGTVLSPRILGKSVNLHPVWVLLAIIVGGSLFGFFGMLIAVPTAAVIQVFVRHWLESYRESAVYLGSPAESESAEQAAGF